MGSVKNNFSELFGYIIENQKPVPVLSQFMEKWISC